MYDLRAPKLGGIRFQFLGIPPKGEPIPLPESTGQVVLEFPISRDPPEGGTLVLEEGRDGLVFRVSNF